MTITKKNINLLIIISSPSGAGKTSICKKLIIKYQNLKLSISDTTRKPRDNEVEGSDYYFIDEQEFEKRIKNREYIEYANVFGNYYGSRYKYIEEILESGKDVLFDIDWQGAEQLRNSKFSNILSIFVVPPSKDVVLERLKSRAFESGDNNNSIFERFSTFEQEMSHKKEYDFVVVNKDLDQCVSEIYSLISRRKIG